MRSDSGFGEFHHLAAAAAQRRRVAGTAGGGVVGRTQPVRRFFPLVEGGAVDELDAARLAGHWGTADDASWFDGDFDGDRRVGPADASILAANWGYEASEGAGTPVPEPTAILLLLAAMGGTPPADAPPAPLAELDWLRAVDVQVTESDSGVVVTFTAQDSATLQALHDYVAELAAAAAPTSLDPVCGMEVNRDQTDA